MLEVAAALGLDLSRAIDAVEAKHRQVPFVSRVGYIGKLSRRERRETGVTARQQRIRKRRLNGPNDKIDARRYERIMDEQYFAASLPEARMFVCFFSLQTLTSMSAVREFSPINMPSYTWIPGSMKISPRSCRL